MRRASSLFFVTLCIALLHIGIARADDAANVPSLGSAATLSVKDGREFDQRGDGNLGWYENRDGGLVARGPDGFSMRVEVASAFLRAGDELGVGLYQGSKGTESYHLEVLVSDFWCDNSADWARCRAALTGRVSGPDGAGEPFELDEEVDGNFEELRGALFQMLLAELARAQAEGLGDPPEAHTNEHPSMRFGWIEQADGSWFVGAIRDESTGICVQSRGGSQTLVPIDEIVDVRVVDVHVPGGVEGTRWAVLPLADGSWLGGRLVRTGDDSTVLVASDGVRIIGPDQNFRVISGPWNAGGPSCERVATGRLIGGAGGLYGSFPRTDEGGDHEGGDRSTRPDDAPVVYVGRRGGRIDDLDTTDKYVFALRASDVGERKWKRYRLDWVSYANAMDSRAVDESLQTWIDLNRRRKANWSGGLAGGIGLAVVSGIASGALQAAWSSTGDSSFGVTIPFVAAGIGVGATIAGISAIQRVKWGKRAYRPDRYHNLLDYLTLDELDAAMAEQDARAEKP